jgi:CNP1-like family
VSRRKLWAGLGLLLLVSLPAHAEWGSFDYDFDENKKPWQEIETQIPPYPKPEDLHEIDVGAASRNTHFLDPKSISLGTDGVARYTILVRSPHGAETVNYEGMRCASGERKIYAFGHKDGSWSRNRYAKWEPVKLTSQIHYAKALYEDYLCPGGAIAKTLNDVNHALKYGRHANPTGVD